jgi:hypothetical protein
MSDAKEVGTQVVSVPCSGGNGNVRITIETGANVLTPMQPIAVEEKKADSAPAWLYVLFLLGAIWFIAGGWEIFY